MQPNIAAMPEVTAVYVSVVTVTMIIAILVVWPAIWSDKPWRRKAAFNVLDRLLIFLRELLNILHEMLDFFRDRDSS